MKFLATLIMGSFLATSAFAGQSTTVASQPAQPKCECTNCKCTDGSHCGCKAKSEPKGPTSSCEENCCGDDECALNSPEDAQ